MSQVVPTDSVGNAAIPIKLDYVVTRLRVSLRLDQLNLNALDLLQDIGDLLLELHLSLFMSAKFLWLLLRRRAKTECLPIVLVLLLKLFLVRLLDVPLHWSVNWPKAIRLLPPQSEEAHTIQLIGDRLLKTIV